MATVLLVIHLMIAAALVGVVLLQKSEGGALGIGGGGGGGGFLTGRGTANLLTRATAMLATAFFATSIALSLVNKQSLQQGSAFDKAAPASSAPATPGEAPAEAPKTGGGILDKIQPPMQSAPAPGQVPGGQ